MSDDMDAGAGAGEGGGQPSAAELLLGAAAAPVTAGGGKAGEAGGEPPAWWNDLPADPLGDKPSHQDWVKAKGLQTPGAVIESYRALEATLGGEKVPVPKGDDDKDGWDRLFKAAGRPDAPEGYGLEAIAGVDADLAKGFAAEAHKMGLNPTQAKAAVQFQLGLVQQQEAKILERDRSEGHALAAALGAQFGEAQERVVRAGFAVGLSADQLGAIRQAVGPKAMFKLLDTVSKAIAEDTLEGGGQGGMGKTAEALAARKAEIMGSTALRQQLAAGDKALRAEWDAIAEAEAEAMKAKKAA